MSIDVEHDIIMIYIRLNSQKGVMSHSQVLVDKKEKRKRSLMKKSNLNKLTTEIKINKIIKISENSPANISKTIKNNVSI